MGNKRTLKKNYEFKNVLNKGNFYVEKQIIVYITKNNKKKNYIGIAINAKLCNAVKRNRIKRLIRENYRIIEHNLKTGYNIVFLWNKNVGIEKASYNVIGKDMEEAFMQAEILEG